MKFIETRVFKAIARVMLVMVFLFSSGIQTAIAATTLPASTPVMITLSETVSSETHPAGSSVSGVVANAIVVDGVTVIPAGAQAMGTVVSASAAGIIGQPGSLMVQFNSVQGAGGVAIPLQNATANAEGKSNATTSIVVGLFCCILGFLMKGENASVAQGTTINAFTASPVQI